MYKHLSFLLK